MLILSRKVDEVIKINGNIIVTVCRVAGDRVKLGIEAPGDVKILRGELDRDDDELKGKGAA